MREMSLPAYTLTVTDEANRYGNCNSRPQRFHYRNDAPTISQTTANNFTEDSTSTGATVGVFDVNDEETADGSLTVTISDETNYAISYDNSGTATVTLTSTGAATVNAGNELPSYTVTVTDGNSSTATATHDPSVTTVNDAPTISQTTANNFTEDSTSTGATVGVFDVNDEETADGSLTVTISDETNYAISYDDRYSDCNVNSRARQQLMPVMSYQHTLSLSPTANSSTATATHDPSVTTVNDAPTISQTTANNFTEDSTSTGATVGVFDVNDEETADGSLTVTISDETNYAISYDDRYSDCNVNSSGRGNS